MFWTILLTDYNNRYYEVLNTCLCFYVIICRMYGLGYVYYTVYYKTLYFIFCEKPIDHTLIQWIVYIYKYSRKTLFCNKCLEVSHCQNMLHFNDIYCHFLNRYWFLMKTRKTPDVKYNGYKTSWPIFKNMS